MTCTPYAINSHRLLVRGERTEYKGEQDKQTKNQMQTGALTKRIVEDGRGFWEHFVAVLIESGIFFDFKT